MKSNNSGLVYWFILVGLALYMMRGSTHDQKYWDNHDKQAVQKILDKYRSQRVN